MKKLLFILAILLLNVTLLFSQGFTTKSKKAIEYYNLSKQAFTKSEKIEYLNNAIKKDNKFVEAYWELSSIWVQSRPKQPDLKLYCQTVLKPYP